MKINELIKELRKFEREHGNLEVGIGRINTTGEKVAYYTDIVIFHAKHSELYTDYDYETKDHSIDTFCALG